MYDSYDEIVKISRAIKDTDLLADSEIDEIWSAARDRYLKKNPNALKDGNFCGSKR